MIRIFNQDPAARRVALGTPAGFLAFGFGSGLFRYAPGTMGTLAAIPFALLLVNLPTVVFWIVLAGLFLAGVHICNVSSERLGQHDPGGIVWDEMVAYWLTVAFLPVSWAWWLAAFILFRFFDILKPPPVRQAERYLRGGLGVVADDLLAGAYAWICLRLLERFWF